MNRMSCIEADEILNSVLNNTCGRPVIVWGTKAAGQIFCRLLQMYGVQITAAGDNNPNEHENSLPEIQVLSMEQISNLYPRAVIMIGSFSCRVSDEIILQLKQSGGDFKFCRFDQAACFYESEYLKRFIGKEERLVRIINNIRKDAVHDWKREMDKRVMLEYRYRVSDSEAKDLERELGNIYAVKNLILITSAEQIHSCVKLVSKLSEKDTAGHIIIALQVKPGIDLTALQQLVRKVFYLICDESADKELISQIRKAGFIVDMKKLPDQLFSERTTVTDKPLTEHTIIKTVQQYAGSTYVNAAIPCELKTDSQPVYIVQLFNGLANQMLMYLFGRFLEENSDRKVIFDDTILCLDVLDKEENIRRIHGWNPSLTEAQIQKGVAQTREKNSFYLFQRAEAAEVFHLPVRLLSDYFDKKTWQDFLVKVKKEISFKYAQAFPLGQLLTDAGTEIAVIRDHLMPEEFLAVNHCCCVDAYAVEMPYQPDSVADFILHGIQNKYFIGIWATGRAKDWLLCNRKWAGGFFRFKPELNKRNEEYERQLKQSDGVIIHIRRGDFALFHMSADAEYFRQAVEVANAMDRYRDKKYFIFSDDIGWCRQHKKELGLEQTEEKICFVEGNTGKYSFMDLYLMTLGKVMIPTPGSSFSYVAALISETMELCVNIPEYVYHLEHGMTKKPVFVELQTGPEQKV